MTRNAFSDDYELDALEEITFDSFRFLVTPRFKSRYVQGVGAERLSFALFRKLAKKSTCAVDVGAHYGDYTLIAAKAVGAKGKVITVEPEAVNREVLKRNIQLNGYEKICDIRKEAVSDRKGTATFNITEASDNAGFYDHPNTKVLQTIKVKTLTLDELTEKQDISIIKVDAEGHENEILEGSKRLLQEGVDILFEFNPKCFRVAKHEPEEVLERFLANDYKILLIDDKDYWVTRIRRPKEWKLHMQDQSYRNMLATKKTDDEIKKLVAAVGARYKRPGLRVLQRLFS